MRSRNASLLPTLARSYVTRPSRLAHPPCGFESSTNPPLPSSSQYKLTRVSPASPASVYDQLEQIPATQAPLLYSQSEQSKVALSREQLEQLQAGRAQGQSISKLARQYGVSRSFVMRHGYPDTLQGQQARQQHDTLRSQAQQASRAKWGLNKWCVLTCFDFWSSGPNRTSVE